ncbi:hypothetical protein D3C86_2002190 [compost metagenome]
MNHGRMPGRALGRRASGPFWSSSQPGIFIRMPGLDSGMTSLTAICPQLHLAVLSPGAAGSMRVTRWPSRCRYSAQHTPTIPPPMTTACCDDACGLFMGAMLS